MQAYYFEENRRIFVAFVLSMILHLCLFISTEIRYRFAWLKHKPDIVRSSKPVTFDLIHEEPPLIMETPEVKEEVPGRPTNILSDKNIASRDTLQNEDAINDMPYAEGKTKIKEIRKEIPQTASIPIKKSEPSPQLQQSETIPVQSLQKGEEKSIEVVPFEQNVQEKVLPDNVPRQDEQIASLPKDILHLPLFDDRLSNARGFGEVTFNAKKHDAAPYVLNMKKKIEANWAPPAIFTIYGLTSGETVVHFKIMPDGIVQDLKVISEKGDESLKTASVRAVTDAGPFEPIPEKLLAGEKEQFLGITFTFYYIIDSAKEE